MIISSQFYKQHEEEERKLQSGTSCKSVVSVFTKIQVSRIDLSGN